jgi:hypothetical protein
MIITGGAVDDMAKHFIAKYGMMVVRVASKFEVGSITHVQSRMSLMSTITCIACPCHQTKLTPYSFRPFVLPSLLSSLPDPTPL